MNYIPHESAIKSPIPLVLYVRSAIALSGKVVTSLVYLYECTMAI